MILMLGPIFLFMLNICTAHGCIDTTLPTSSAEVNRYIDAVKPIAGNQSEQDCNPMLNYHSCVSSSVICGAPLHFSYSDCVRGAIERGLWHGIAPNATDWCVTFFKH
jgi:hypothetical protein